MKATRKNPGALRENLRQAHAYLESELEPEAKIGVIGWCFGGGWSLQLALMMQKKLDAAVIYYGRLITESKRLSRLQAPVLGIFGSEGHGISVDAVREFESALQDLGKAAEIHVYEGASHAFTNPSGNRYNAEAADDAWQKTLAFLRQHLGA